MCRRTDDSLRRTDRSREDSIILDTYIHTHMHKHRYLSGTSAKHHAQARCREDCSQQDQRVRVEQGCSSEPKNAPRHIEHDGKEAVVATSQAGMTVDPRYRSSPFLQKEGYSRRIQWPVSKFFKPLHFQRT